MVFKIRFISKYGTVNQFLIRFQFLAEVYEEKNPFKQLLLFDLNKANESLLSCIKTIPKVGDKNAQILLKTYSSNIIS